MEYSILNSIFPGMRKSVYTAQYGILLELLAQARSKSGLTQRHLARKVGMKQSSISKIERGERRLDVIELHQWCNVLGVSFRELMAELDRKLGGIR